MNVAKKKCKRSLAYLMALIMLISIFPISAFAEGETAEVGITEKVEAPETPEIPENTNKSKSNLDLVAEQLWDGIKGENTDKDSVTKNLSLVECASVDSKGIANFKIGKWNDNVNVMIEWKPIQDDYKDYIRKLGNFLITRPEKDKEIILEAVLSNKGDNGEKKNVSIRFIIKGEITKKS